MRALREEEFDREPVRTNGDLGYSINGQHEETPAPLHERPDSFYNQNFDVDFAGAEEDLEEGKHEVGREMAFRKSIFSMADRGALSSETASKILREAAILTKGRAEEMATVMESENLQTETGKYLAELDSLYQDGILSAEDILSMLIPCFKSSPVINLQLWDAIKRYTNHTAFLHRFNNLYYCGKSSAENNRLVLFHHLNSSPVADMQLWKILKLYEGIIDKASPINEPQYELLPERVSGENEISGARRYLHQGQIKEERECKFLEMVNAMVESDELSPRAARDVLIEVSLLTGEKLQTLPALCKQRLVDRAIGKLRQLDPKVLLSSIGNRCAAKEWAGLTDGTVQEMFTEQFIMLERRTRVKLESTRIRHRLKQKMFRLLHIG
jgi:hypothetical protein